MSRTLYQQPSLWVRIAPYLALALSGFGALGHQLVWVRRLSTGIGHELPAMLAVVSAFFLGNAVGAIWFAQTRHGYSIRIAVFLEAVVAGWALVLLPLIPLANDWVHQWVGAEGAGFRQSLFSFWIPGLILLPATAAMGAVFPAVATGISTHPDNRFATASLYAANTAGALVGVVGAIGWVVPAMGFGAASAVFAGFNLLAAGVLFFGCPVRGLNSAGPPTESGVSSGELQVRTSPWLLAVTGFLAVGYECWAVRELSQVLENTVYSFATTLGVFLLGNAVGAAVGPRWSISRQRPVLLCGLAATCLLGGWVLARSAKWGLQLRAAWGDSAVLVLGVELVLAGAVLLLPSCLMGALFAELMGSVHGRVKQGRALALNLLGSALAPAVIGAAAFPTLRGRGTLLVIAGGYLLMVRGLQGWRWLWVGLPAGLAMFVPELSLQRVGPDSRLVTVREGAGDTVAVVEQLGGARSLRVNNRFSMGGTAPAAAERRHGLIPLLLHPNPRKALFIGVGTGISFASMGSHPGVVADGIELVPEVLEVLPNFAPHNTFAPGLRIVSADARRFVRATPNRYDVVVADLFHPARDGAGFLYTREHFRAIRERLEPGGLFCQWLPLFQLDEPMLQSVVETFVGVFPNAHAWLLRWTADVPVLGLIGWAQRPEFRPRDWPVRTSDARLREALRPLLLTEDLQLFGLWMGDAQWLREFSNGARENTDDRPVVLFGAPRVALRREADPSALLRRLLDIRRPPVDRLGVISGEPWKGRLDDFRSARDLYLRGLIADSAGRNSEAEELFIESARVSPDFSSAYAQILTRATSLMRANPSASRRLLQALERVRPERPVARELLNRM